jgi:peptidoglycan/LPS O-acetylase OafA/YrhL
VTAEGTPALSRNSRHQPCVVAFDLLTNGLVVATTPKSGYLPTLDGWRAVAVFGVLLDHVVGYSPLRDVPVLRTISHTGPNGVSLFFAISGFLICSRLLEEQNAFGRISLRGFYIRRAFRILPPAMFYLVVVAFLSLLGFIVVTRAEWISSVFFFRNYLPESWIRRGWGGYTVHYWSLAVEEHFYLIWPAALVLLGKMRARWFAMVIALGVAGWRMWEFHHHWLDRLIPGLLIGSRTDIRLDALLLGCLAALLLDEEGARDLVVRHYKTWMWTLLVATYVLLQLLQHTRTYSLLESTLLPLIIVGTVCRPNMWVGRLLEFPLLKWRVTQP